MKRILCIFFFVAIAIMSAMAQQKTLTGKYNKKVVEITYTELGAAQYKITSISIEGKSIDKIIKERDDLKKEKENLSKQINPLRKRVEEIQNELEICRKGNANANVTAYLDSINSLRNQLNEKTNDYNILNDRLKEKEQEIETMRELKSGLESGEKQAIGELNSEIESLKERINMLLAGKDLNNDVVSFGALFGGDRMKNDRVSSSSWSNDIVFVQQYELTYTHYFSKKSPFAVKVGLGFSNLSGSASFASAYDTVSGLTDGDGDIYDARYSFRDVEETVHLKYLDIPIMLHLGNSYTTLGVQAWCEVGLKASINIGSSFSGQGTYSVQGYYPGYNVVVSDIPSAGFVTDSPIAYSDDTEVNGFVLWGQLAAGLHIPLGKKIGLNFGAKCAYTLLPVSSGDDAAQGSTYTLGTKNILNGGNTRIFLAGVEVGLTYQF